MQIEVKTLAKALRASARGVMAPYSPQEMYAHHANSMQGFNPQNYRPISEAEQQGEKNARAVASVLNAMASAFEEAEMEEQRL